MASSPERRPWSRDEHILAFNLYCKIPFGTIHMRNPRVIELASLIGRTVGAVSYKLANFARLDPSLQARGIRGLEHGAIGEVETWKEFYDDPESLAYESERLLADRTGKPIGEYAGIDEADLPKEGLERESLVRQRVNQQFFRKAVLAAYDGACCITGIAIADLLVASHIAPWAMDKKNRMNPRNGLCLNALHDRAFDRGLLTVTAEGEVRLAHSLLSREREKDTGLSWLLSFNGTHIRAPSRFLPDPELLAQHSQRLFRDLEIAP